VDLRQLEYFVNVARKGTYLAAAASLSVAQPVVWRQVKDLERELGTPLFERVGRRVRLTRDGSTLADQAEGILAAAGRLRASAEALRVGRAGFVAIACAAPHLREFLAPVIAALRAAQPDLQVNVREYSGGGPGPGPGMLADLLDGTVDLATGLGTGDPKLETIPLYEARLLLPVPDAHPWRDESAIEVVRLQDVPLVLAQPGSYSRGAIEAACGRAAFAPIIGFDSPNALSILALGHAGLGVPVVVEDALPGPSGRPWPVLTEGGRALGGTIRLGWRAGTPRAAAVSAFIELARAEAARRGVEGSAEISATTR
jgi:DNA-binding transcriptional LysR family regulator